MSMHNKGKEKAAHVGDEKKEPVNCSHLYLDDAVLSAKEQAQHILDRIAFLHAEGAKKVGIPFSAQEKTLHAIQGSYAAKKFPEIPKKQRVGQAEVMHEVLALLKTKQYSKLAEVVMLFPIAITREEGKLDLAFILESSVLPLHLFLQEDTHMAIVLESPASKIMGQCIALGGDKISQLLPRDSEDLQDNMRQALHGDKQPPDPNQVKKPLHGPPASAQLSTLPRALPGMQFAVQKEKAEQGEPRKKTSSLPGPAPQPPSFLPPPNLALEAATRVAAKRGKAGNEGGDAGLNIVKL